MPEKIQNCLENGGFGAILGVQTSKQWLWEKPMRWKCAVE